MNNELDCRGLQCPEPVARCRALVEAVHPLSLTVLVDNMAALENVSRYLHRNAYITSSAQLAEKEWRLSAHLAEQKEGESPAPEAPAEAEPGCVKTLVLLTTESLGRGDDELGAKLMNTFLSSLPELGPALWRVILLNGAVKLSAREGAALDSLKALEAAGVDILVCGTCLMHYGLLEKKQVGETTNMMDVVTSLGLARKVIRP